VTSPIENKADTVTTDEFNGAFAGLLSRVYRLNVKGMPGQHDQPSPFDIYTAVTREEGESRRKAIN
jgi:hypothetical protein